MNPYLYTLAFLMLMSFLTSSEALRFSHNSMEKKCYLSSLETQAATEELRELSHLANFRVKENQAPKNKKKADAPLKKSKNYVRKAAALGVDASRPPDNSRLNFHNLFFKNPSKKNPKEFSLYEVFARLIRTLYKGEPFLVQDIEYKLLDRLIEKKEACKFFTSVDQLAEIDLEDEELQETFYKMLTGTQKSPSLFNYTTFNSPSGDGKAQSRKINLLFADPLIVEAILPNGDTAKKLIAARDHIWAQIADQEEHRLERESGDCLGRGAFAALLKDAAESILTYDGYPTEKYSSQVFDYTLEHKGTVIFLEDPGTGRLLRKKYTPQKPIANK